MNSETLTYLFQKGFRVSLGATATLIEILQDPLKREENLSKLRTELAQLAEEWAGKGEVTEREARNYVDAFLSKQHSTAPSPSSEATEATPPPAPTSSASPEVQLELQELTAQLSAIRAELENLRSQDSGS